MHRLLRDADGKLKMDFALVLVGEVEIFFALLFVGTYHIPHEEEGKRRAGLETTTNYTLPTTTRA